MSVLNLENLLLLDNSQITLGKQIQIMIDNLRALRNSLETPGVHNMLTGRDAVNSHTISSIDGLETALQNMHVSDPFDRQVMRVHQEFEVIGNAVWEEGTLYTPSQISLQTPVFDIDFTGGYTPSASSFSNVMILTDARGRQAWVNRYGVAHAIIPQATNSIVIWRYWNAVDEIPESSPGAGDGVPAIPMTHLFIYSNNAWNPKTKWTMRDIFENDDVATLTANNWGNVTQIGNVEANTKLGEASATVSDAVARINSARINALTVFGSATVPTMPKGDVSSNVASTEFVCEALSTLIGDSISGNRIIPRPIGIAESAWKLSTANLTQGVSVGQAGGTFLDIRKLGSTLRVYKKGSSNVNMTITIMLGKMIDMTNGHVRIRMKYGGTKVPSENPIVPTSRFYLLNGSSANYRSTTMKESRLTTGEWVDFILQCGTGMGVAGTFDFANVDGIYWNFTDQMAGVTEEQFEVLIDEIELIPAIPNGFGVQPIPFLMWFDDGYKTQKRMTEIANSYGIPTTHSLVTDYVNSNNVARMNWDDIAELAEQGNIFVNHSKDHNYPVNHPTNRQDIIDRFKIARDVLNDRGYYGRYLVIPSDITTWEMVYSDGDFNFMRDLFETGEFDGFRNTNDLGYGSGTNVTFAVRPKLLNVGRMTDFSNATNRNSHVLLNIAHNSPHIDLLHDWTSDMNEVTFTSYCEYIRELALQGLIIPCTIKDVFDRRKLL